MSSTELSTLLSKLKWLNEVKSKLCLQSLFIFASEWEINIFWLKIGILFECQYRIVLSCLSPPNLKRRIRAVICPRCKDEQTLWSHKVEYLEQLDKIFIYIFGFVLYCVGILSFMFGCFLDIFNQCRNHEGCQKDRKISIKQTYFCSLENKNKNILYFPFLPEYIYGGSSHMYVQQEKHLE